MKESKVFIKILLILMCFGYIGLNEIKLILSLFTFNVATKFKVSYTCGLHSVLAGECYILAGLYSICSLSAMVGSFSSEV